MTIYDLKTGDSFMIVSCTEAFCGSYRVENVIENIAVCTGESGKKLMLPLHVAMPFAVLTGNTQPAAAPVAEAQPADEAGTKEPETAEAAPADAVPAPEAPAAETPAPAAPAVEKPAAAPQKPFIRPAITPDPEEKTGAIAYYDPAGHWGKIAHARFKNGLFFFIDQVTDESFKAQLMALKPGDTCPAFTVCYTEQPNPRHPRSIYAGGISLVSAPESTAEAPVSELKQMTGYLEKFANGQGTISCPEANASFRFRLKDVNDEKLADYLKNELPFDGIENLNLEVSFVQLLNKAVQIAWKQQPKTETAPDAEEPSEESVSE